MILRISTNLYALAYSTLVEMGGSIERVNERKEVVR